MVLFVRCAAGDRRWKGKDKRSRRVRVCVLYLCFCGQEFATRSSTLRSSIVLLRQEMERRWRSANYNSLRLFFLLACHGHRSSCTLYQFLSPPLSRLPGLSRSLVSSPLLLLHPLLCLPPTTSSPTRRAQLNHARLNKWYNSSSTHHWYIQQVSWSTQASQEEGKGICSRR